MNVFDLNFVAIMAAVVASMLSGAAWYSIFAKPWMKAVGYSEVPQPDPKIYIVAAIAQLIIALTLSILFAHFPSIELVSGVVAGFFLWLGFCAAPMAVNHRFQSKGWDLTLIDAGFWLVVFVLQGGIIGWLE